MFMEVSISIVIFSVFALILWRLNSIKKPHRNTNTRANNTSVQYRATKSNIARTDNSLASEFTEKVTKEFNVDDVELPKEFNSLKLIKTDINNKEQQQVIEEICRGFRKPHPLLLPLTQKAFEPNELFDLIKSDPQITAKVLNRVNSSAFALKQPITSINHAIIYLGIGTVKNIAMHFAVENEVKFESNIQQNAYQKLWSASYLASSLGLLFAKELLLDDASDISTRCLLNYLGDMAILSTHPELAPSYNEQKALYQRVSDHQSQLNINTQIIGSTLARYWQLPRTLVRSIENNLSFLAATPASETNDINENEQVKYQVCYIACRLADLAVINEKSCLETIRYDLNKQLDFYYLFKNEQQPKVKQLLNLFHDMSFSKKVNSLLLIN